MLSSCMTQNTIGWTQIEAIEEHHTNTTWHGSWPSSCNFEECSTFFPLICFRNNITSITVLPCIITRSDGGRCKKMMSHEHSPVGCYYSHFARRQYICSVPTPFLQLSWEDSTEAADCSGGLHRLLWCLLLPWVHFFVSRLCWDLGSKNANATLLDGTGSDFELHTRKNHQTPAFDHLLMYATCPLRECRTRSAKSIAYSVPDGLSTLD